MTTLAASRSGPAGGRLPAIALVVCLSLIAAAAVASLQELAIGAGIFIAILVLTFVRPRYGLYTIIFCLTALEAMDNDPISKVGALLQWDVSSWTPIRFVNVSLIEVLLIVTTLSVLGRCVINHRAPHSFQLKRPLMVFSGLMLVSVIWGLAQGGNLTTALWETRSLFAAGLIAFLVPNVLPRKEDIEHLVNVYCAGVVVLSLDVIWRRFAVIPHLPALTLDLAYDHVTPILMNVVVVLLLARLIWPATARQRSAALLVPLILYAEMVTERRAGWVALDVGLILVCIFVFRLRQRLFYVLVLPLLLLYAGYLVAFWNGQGVIAQPARAVRSVTNPDARDAASDLYRVFEQQDIRLNIDSHPLTGLGFGEEFKFYVPLPDLSWWPFWHFETHDSVLWLWMEMGPVGFIAFLSLMGMTVVRGVQLLRVQNGGRSEAILIAFVGFVLMFATYGFVDLAMINLRLTATLGLAIGIIGAWGSEQTLGDGTRMADGRR